jgi:hypothetical protein
MRALLIAVLLSAACGGTYDTQCAGPVGIECDLVGLPICTSSYGDHAPHAFCTRECATDDDCGNEGLCAAWRFPRESRRVCVAPNWLTVPR